MSITTRDQMLDAMGNNATSLVIDKASIATQIAAGWSSLWRATGAPAQGAIPTAAAVCTNALLGCFSFTNPVAPACTYLPRIHVNGSNAACDLQIHDRLAHMGGLSGIVVSPTAQTANVDVSGATSNLAARRGDANYSDVQWWLEWYTATGSTARNATCAVTYDDDSTGNIVVVVPASTAAGRLLPIVSAVAGRWIKSVQSVTLDLTTGTAGNFGVTATRFVTSMPILNANTPYVFDWAMLGNPRVHDSACLMMLMVTATTSTGTVRGGGKLAQG